MQQPAAVGARLWRPPNPPKSKTQRSECGGPWRSGCTANVCLDARERHRSQTHLPPSVPNPMKRCQHDQGRDGRPRKFKYHVIYVYVCARVRVYHDIRYNAGHESTKVLDANAIGGVFAQRAHSAGTARAQCAHSANYYGDYPGNNPENHPPAESCTTNSNLKNSNI